MPDKEGSDDEKKSTKSVVNKKQKQMMGEEGYDIARDMGKVRPSKDKKDATTMPVSKEMRKTQKVNKGPSALELVKKKYGKAVMNVGKKKANEELDLTQVAEAFGGYIIEANGKKNGKKKDDSIDDFIKADDPFNVKAKEQAKKDIEKEPETMDIDTFQGRQKFKEPVSGTTQAKGFKPKPGSVKFTKKPGERPVKSYIDPSVIDPKFAKKQPSKSRTEVEDERKASRSFKKDLGKEKIVSPTMQDELEKITAKPQPKKSRKRRSDAKSLEQIKKEIDARNPTYKSPITGGELPVGGADYQERQQKAYQSGIEAAARGTQTGNIPVDPYKILPAGQKGQEGTPQKDRPTEKPIEKSVTGVFTGQGTGRKDVIGRTKNKETGNRRSTTQDQQKLNTAQTGVKPDGTYASPEERKKLFQQSKGESETMKNVKRNLTKGALVRTGGQLAKKTDTHTPIDVATKKEPSLFSKTTEVIRKNPVASFIAYDIGKGVLGKILNTKRLAPGVVGGTVGRRSARGGGGL